MLRHIFSAIDSPCCANFALQKTADENRTAFPLETAERVKRNFYVDDLLKSVENIASAIQLARELQELLGRGGFRLMEWASNDRAVLPSIDREERERPAISLHLDDLPTERVLFDLWKVEGDSFVFKHSDLGKPATKRGILSMVSLLSDRLVSCLPSSLLRRS